MSLDDETASYDDADKMLSAFAFRWVRQSFL